MLDILTRPRDRVGERNFFKWNYLLPNWLCFERSKTKGKRCKAIHLRNNLWSYGIPRVGRGVGHPRWEFRKEINDKTEVGRQVSSVFQPPQSAMPCTLQDWWGQLEPWECLLGRSEVLHESLTHDTKGNISQHQSEIHRFTGMALFVCFFPFLSFYFQ